MAKRMLAAFALILAMTAAAEAQFTTLQGWIIVPGKDHADNFEVRITAREGFEPFASTTVSDTGRYMFTHLDLSVGNFDVLINVEGYRESRTRLATLPPNIMRTDFEGASMNIILIPDPESRRHAQRQEAYNAALLDEYSRGLEQVTNKHPELAVTHLEKVANEVPDFYDAHINLGFVYQDLLRWKEAETEFRSAHELNAESARPLVALGRLHVEEVELEIEARATPDVLRPLLAQAREELAEAIELDPKLAKAFYYLGAVDFRSRSYADAESESKHALELDPRLFEARILRINLFIEQKRWQAALDNADAFLLDYPDSSHRAEVAASRVYIVARLDEK